MTNRGTKNLNFLISQVNKKKEKKRENGLELRTEC